MKKIIVEVGSASTKIDEYDGKNVKHLETYCIAFKRNFKKENKLDENDVELLINKIKELQEITSNVYVCGTSIFRNLTDELKNEFLNKFKTETGLNFEIISQEKENELTVVGAAKKVNQKVAVFVGGGGSTEITIYENGIKKMSNTKMGVIDVMNQYQDLANDLPVTNIESVKSFVSERLDVPDEKVDVMILAGGGHKYFALNSGFNYDKNDLYEDDLQPIKMDIKTRTADSDRYYKTISLDEIRNRVDDPNWWYATRAMVATVLVAAEKMGVKYIVPTDISMVYGLLDK